MNTVSVNNNPFSLTETDLPCVISYPEKSGGSYTSIVLLTQILSAGSKIIFFTAYPMAKNELLEQIGTDNINVFLLTENEQIEHAKDFQVIIIQSGNEILLRETINRIPDIEQRVLFIKNIENYTEETVLACMQFQKRLISGDINMCANTDFFRKTYWETIIAFAEQVNLSIPVPSLEKYQAYVQSSRISGILSMQK